MLQRFPEESKGRRKKLQEVCLLKMERPWTISFYCLRLAQCMQDNCLPCLQVGYVTTICFTCFLIRCVMVSIAYSFRLLSAQYKPAIIRTGMVCCISGEYLVKHVL